MSLREECLVKNTSEKSFRVYSDDDNNSIKIINEKLAQCKEYKVDKCLMNQKDGKQCDKLLLANIEEHFIEFKSNHDFSKGIDQLASSISKLSKNKEALKHSYIVCNKVGKGQSNLLNKIAKFKGNNQSKFKFVSYKNFIKVS